MSSHVTVGLLLCFRFGFLYLCSVFTTDLKHTERHIRPQQTGPDQVDPSHWPVPSPPPSSLEGCIHQHSPIVLFTSYLFCWSDDLTPPPLGPDRRPRGSPRWTSKLCLAMPQVRGTTERGELDCERHTGGRASSKQAGTNGQCLTSEIWKNHNFVQNIINTNINLQI